MADHYRSEPIEALRLESVDKVYGTEDNPVRALDSVTVGLAPGSFTAIMGPSGSGKSTFLQCAAGLDQPTRGRVFVDGAELTGESETALTKFRRQRIGFVFQQFNLMPTLTVYQNVTLPLRMAGKRSDRDRTTAMLRQVGLADRMGHRPSELSGGQQQRAAIARALVTDPRVIFADEPTGALDTKSARDVLQLLRSSVDHLGQTVVMVTHDPVAASYADSVMFLADGRSAGTLDKPTAETVAERMTHLGDEVHMQDASADAGRKVVGL
ncbi:putative ABC transport system ATP-binding protein [Haloactinopolyspora alba]|uniref:Putative ABC transport system ATP-binding protein n=1 Tax=Haloactinopolyspora alba TaxID=648780 RepID=A0A2P8EFL0_9ACTN|nr:ABC transporter ATP-binding protein [Haloactinopolyspora alba]PSL08243.1 putative ABC transport system ATP-binding protein [Haloactinopolyspora alba]